MFIIYLSIILITTSILVSGYFHQVDTYEELELQRLKGIVSALAHNIDGDEHEYLTNNYPWKDDLKNLKDDSVYRNLETMLAGVQNASGLNHSIYTLQYQEDERLFHFILRSDTNVYYDEDLEDSTMYFRAQYENFPVDLIDKMDTGGVIKRYTSENGEWISGFYPIKNSDGKTVAIIEADIEFGEFIAKARETYFNFAAIALGFIVFLALITFPFIRKILKEDEELKEELLYQNELIELKNKELNDSVNYAVRIQEAMLPDIDLLLEDLPNSFIFYKPRDGVSGDFYWHRKHQNFFYFATADCTGHGVPGALMSMIGQAKLNAITADSEPLKTNFVLTELDRLVTQSLSSKSYKTETKDGMDIALMRVNISERKLEFSGAFMNLVKINNGEITEYKGNRFPIGGGNSYNKGDFSSVCLDIKPGDNFYTYSDGFPDQFGGHKEKKYLNKRFKNFLVSINELSPAEKQQKLNEELTKWQGELEQVDDVLVVGLGF